MSVAKFVIRLCVGVGLVAFLFNKHEVANRDVFVRMLDAPVLVLLGALALNLAGQTLSAYRWGLLSAMGGRPASFPKTWAVYFSGMFFNMCLPTSIGGDVIRVVGMSRQTGTKSGAFASVFMDRNVGLAALLVIGLASSTAMRATIEATVFKHHFPPLPIWPIFAFLLAGWIAANAAIFSDSFCHAIEAVISRVRLGFLNVKLERLHNSVQAFRKPVRAYAWTFLLSLIYQLSEIGVVCLLAWGMGIPLSPLVFCALVPFQAIASLLPITFNGVGVREAIFCAILMGQLGRTADVKNTALALSLTFFSIIVVSSLIGGIVYLVSGMPRPTKAETEDVTQAETEAVA
ncbi:MAG TPA: lysylphosphatidylglycerol synthase transmembrane domain-containing protein [Planctomycetota bacterium]|jgi:hypothetical protein